MSTARKDAICGIIDQGLISLSNLGIGVFLVKATSKYNYGLYGIGFSAILLFVGVANALITTQMTVIAPEKYDKKKYCCSMLYGQYFIFIPILIFSVVACGFLFYCRVVTFDLFVYILILCIVVACSTFHEFMRRYFYVILEPYMVLKIDIVNIVITFVGLFFVYFFNIDLSHMSTMVIYGLSSLMAGVTGIFFANFIQKIYFSEIIFDMKEAWRHGRWALGGVIVTWLQSQSYVALLSILATTSSIAEANAARLFLAPVGVVSSSLGQVFIPRLAMLRNDDKHDAVVGLAEKILFLIVAVICLVVSAIFLLKDYLIHSFLPGEYSNIGVLVYLWALVYLSQAVRMNASILLQIYKKFRVITCCNFCTALATVLITLFLVKINGIGGSIQAIALGELLLALLLLRSFNVYKKSYR